MWHGKLNRNERFYEWLHDGRTNSVFIGGGYERGISLDGDICRFQVIVKFPFPNPTDVIVMAKHRLMLNSLRRDILRGLLDICQAAERGTRSMDDRSMTCILDSHASKLIRSKVFWRCCRNGSGHG